MNRSPNSKAADVFANALELPEAERAAYLDRTCPGDPALRREVESLLAIAPRASLAFERPLLSAPPQASAKLLGTNVGPYRLTEWIAEGGMGAVYGGERIDREYEKKVAVKLIRSGAGSDEMLRRFRQERQVLASLEHPHIARLLDGGSTATGDPYIVMEYIDGAAIDRYCDDRRLTIRERLGLFLDACDAVHFAHRHLVIHRDLKPNNILVDRGGQVKLLDFGIARVVEPSAEVAPDGEVMTAFRALTPRYASPEQLRGAGITTSSDVYSLGVILCELLTGLPPHNLRGLTPAQAERVVCESEPPWPSRLVAESSTLAATAECRKLSPQKLRHALAGDLDTIILHALAHDPERRYQSAEELATDIRAHLAGLPVRARRDTAMLRLSRFARRHRALVSAIGAIVVILAVALAGTFAAYRRATERTLAAEHLAYVNGVGGAESSILLDRIADAEQRLRDAPERRRGFEWRHLTARLDRSETHWRGHRGGVTQIAWLPGSSKVVTCSTDSSVALWQIDGTEIRRWSGQSSGIESICIPPGEREIIAGLSNGVVLRLPLDPALAPIELSRDGKWAMVAASRSGRWIAAGFFDGKVKVWNPTTGALLAHLTAHSGLAIPQPAPHSDDLLTVGADGRLVWWDGTNFRQIRSIPAHRRRVYSLTTSETAGWIATGSLDRTASVWNPQGKAISSFHGHAGTVVALAIDAAAGRVVSAGADGRLAVWNGTTGELRTNLRGFRADASALAISPDGRFVAAGDWGGDLRIWPCNAEDVRTISANSDEALVSAVESADHGLDGKLLAYCTREGKLVLRDLSSDEDRLLAPRMMPRHVALSPNGLLIACTGEQGALEIFDAVGGESVAFGPAKGGGEALPAPSRSFAALAWSPDGRQVVTLAEDGIYFWDPSDLRPLDHILTQGALTKDSGPAEPPATLAKKPADTASAMGISPDGTRFAIGSADGALRIWSRRGQLLTSLVGHSGSICGVAFASSGAALASVAEDGNVILWELPSGRLMQSVHIAKGRSTVAFSHDGSRIAAGGTDEVVRLFDAATLEELVALHGHVARITALAFGPKDEVLMSASSDGTIRLWDAPAAGAKASLLIQ